MGAKLAEGREDNEFPRAGDDRLMFELPGLEAVERMVISKEVVEGTARPLYIYSDRREDIGAGA